ncbi:DUF2878 domain-containing protein [Pseudomonas sp.]|uniref:DUF2878 domain-containing protein n=1 Tax=Pseudomonas sp. TaxID=306 RepID=UPI001B2DFF19|nr:DUF2878 domain-containing protein [Pseudomonas sp.]MBO9549338.1 DUF2878 domain-containing protein [Pseudomonas sp.]
MGRRGWLLGNALWLQAGWWLCVLGAHRPWLLLMVVIGLLLHLWLSPSGELRVLLWVAVAGCLLDSTLGMFGVFSFNPRPLPPWLALLWLVLASGMRHSLAGLGQPAWLAVLLGLFGGPLAYLAGARLAGVGLPLGRLETALVLAPVWALALPLALRFAARG